MPQLNYSDKVQQMKEQKLTDSFIFIIDRGENAPFKKD